MKEENIVRLENWTDLVDAMQVTYTLGFREACERLKSSRSWMTTHIRPFVPAVYLSSGYGTSKANWVRLAGLRLNKQLSDSIYLDELAFDEYVRGCIYSCTKQIKSVPYTYFMDPKSAKAYSAEYDHFTDLIGSSKDLKDIENYGMKRRTCHLDYIKDDAAYLFDDEAPENRIVNVGKRTLVQPVPVPIPDIPINEWMAVHDLKGYGDVDETIYRQLYREGCIRLELHFPDSAGVIGKKIYYTKDPDWIEDPYHKKRLLITEKQWIDYLSKHPKTK